MNDRNNFTVSSWMSRRSPPPTVPETTKPTEPLPVEKPTGRHSVIRTKLPNWYTYRSWVDKTRASWEDKK